MKRCPQCQSVYEDAKNFCLNDGTPLVADSAEARPVTPTPAAPATQPFQSAQPTQSVGWTQAGSWQSQQQPGSSLSQPQPRKRRVWPWVVGVLGVVVVGVVGLLGVIGYVGYKVVREAERQATAPGNAGTTRPAIGNEAGPSGSTTAGSSTAPRGVMSGAAKATTDRDEVLEQLKELEEEWARANIQGDKQALERILAEEYVGTSSDGVTERKAEYIRNIRPSEDLESQSFEDMTVVVGGERAVLTGVTVAQFKDGRNERYRFVDTFVWRDGRWQAVTSVTTEVE